MAKKQKNGLKDLANVVEMKSRFDVAALLEETIGDTLAAADTAKAYLDDAFAQIEEAKAIYAQKEEIDAEIKRIETEKSALMKDIESIESGIKDDMFKDHAFLDAQEKLGGTPAWNKVLDVAHKQIDAQIHAETDEMWDEIRSVRSGLDELLAKSGELLVKHQQHSDKANELFDLNREVCRENGLPVRPDKSKKKGGDFSS